MSIGRLIVEFEARTGKFETDTGRAAKIMEKRAREIEARARKIGTVIGAAFSAAAVGIGVLVKKSIDAADKFDDMAEKTGIAIGALSQLDYAARLNGVEDLEGSLIKFNRSVGEAAQGTKAQADAFKTLGVEIRNADGTLKNTETLFTETAEAISKLPDGIRKTQLAIDLFGKSGAQLIPFLNQGKAGLAALRKEADDLGLTLDERTGKAADGFNKNLDRLGSVATGIGTRLASQLAPELERLTGLLVQTAKDSDAVAMAADGIAVTFKGLVLIGIGVSNTFQIIGKSFASLAAAMVSAASGNFTGALEALQAGGDDVLADIEDIKKAYASLFGAAPSARAPSPARRGGDSIADDDAASARRKAADDAATEAERRAKAIEDSIAALKEESAAYGLSREQLEARKLAQMGATDEQVRSAYELTKYIGLQEAAAQADEERARILEATRTPAEEYAATIERLNFLFDYGKKDIETYTRAVDAAAARMDAATQKNKEKTEELSEYAKEAARNTQNIIADALVNGFDDGAKGILRSFAQMIQQLAAQALAAQIAQKLFGSAAGGGATGGGWVGMAASFLGSYFGGGKASGGLVSAGVPYLVGERGPEMMIPSTAGKIVPNHMMGGGSQNIRIVNQFDGGFVGDYMMSAEGEKVIDNYVSRNGAKIRNILQNG